MNSDNNDNRTMSNLYKLLMHVAYKYTILMCTIIIYKKVLSLSNHNMPLS